MIVTWNDSLAIGVERVDKQHKSLIDQTFSLVEAMSEGRADDEVEGMIGFLEEYVKVHFREEENFMRQIGFPGYQEQCKMHQILIRDVAALKEEFIESGATPYLAVQINIRVGEWLGNHISGGDVKIGEYYKNEVKKS